MAYSYVTRTGDGTKTSFSFNFTGADEAYLRQSDIQVTVDNVSVPFTFLSSNTIDLGTAPSDGAVILIRRIMPKSETYADFSTGNNFGQEVLNNSFLQLLYVVHELLDGWFPEGFTVRQAVTFLEDVLIDGNLHINGSLTTGSSDSNDPDSVVTFDEGDTRYVNKSGDTMGGPLHVNSPQAITEPARKGQLDQEKSERISEDDSIIADYKAADANLQEQISDTAPLEASAFSPISWHKQTIDNSLNIPDNVNAWSFGPLITVSDGVTITLGTNSHWTVANGEVQ